MKIVINDRQQAMNPESVQQTRSRLAASLSKFGHRIGSVNITVDDLNGPRGGIDQSCRIVVKIRQMGEVVSTSADKSLHKAITRAIDRVERAVARRIQKRAMPDRDRYARFGFAVYK